MKRCEFLDLQTAHLLEEKPSLTKKEDTSLPSFSTDVPIASTTKEDLESVQVDYVWNSVYVNSPFLRIKSIRFRKSEQLESMVRLRVRDGIDTIALRSGSAIYLLRKTTKDVALALLGVYARLQESVEDIIGYLQTLAGTFYYISKIPLGAWTFDPQLAQDGSSIKPIEPGGLNESQRQKLCELVQDRLLALHSKNLVLRSFTLHNILFTSKELLLTDLRDMRAVRKKSVLPEDFLRVLSYLIHAGLAARADVYQAVVSYAVAMESACQGWYREKKGQPASDSLALVGALEESLYI